VHDYTGRQVARVGVFTHASDERPFSIDQTAAATELARSISLRLGHLPPMALVSSQSPASSFQPGDRL